MSCLVAMDVNVMQETNYDDTNLPINIHRYYGKTTQISSWTKDCNREQILFFNGNEISIWDSGSSKYNEKISF